MAFDPKFDFFQTSLTQNHLGHIPILYVSEESGGEKKKENGKSFRENAARFFFLATVTICYSFRVMPELELQKLFPEHIIDFSSVD